MTSPATPAPDNKKLNRKRNLWSIFSGSIVGAVSMACAAAVTAMSAGAAAGVPCLVIAVSAFALDFVIQFAKTDDFKLVPALSAAAVTAGAIGIAFNVVATRMEEQEKKQHQSAPVGTTITHSFDRAAAPSAKTISYAEATRRLHAVPTPAAARL